MRSLLVVLLGLGVAAPSWAQTMPLSDFLPRAEALQERGMMAMLSHDLKPIMSEANAAFTAYKKQLDAERAAGHPSACPPTGNVAVSADELIKSFGTIPADARAHTTTQQGVAHLMAVKYPCAH